MRIKRGETWYSAGSGQTSITSGGVAPSVRHVSKWMSHEFLQTSTILSEGQPDRRRLSLSRIHRLPVQAYREAEENKSGQACIVDAYENTRTISEDAVRNRGPLRWVLPVQPQSHRLQ